jgi:hypothetical protein
MILQFGNTKLYDWEEHSPTRWIRNNEWDIWYPVSLKKTYSFHSNGHVWYPEFFDNFLYLQPIYNISTNYKEFQIEDIKDAMAYVDQFLIRMSNLKSFM